MRVYLSRYEIYKNGYGDLCNPKNGSSVFIDFDKAYKCTLDEINSFIEDSEVNKTEHDEYYFPYGGLFKIRERDTEDKSVHIIHRYDLHGKLFDVSRREGRRAYTVSDSEPPEYKPGDVVRLKRHNEQRKDDLFVIALFQDDRRYYFVVSTNDNGYAKCRIIHKNDLEPYTGAVPKSIDILRKTYKGETRISVGRLKELFGQEFRGNITARFEMMCEDLTDDSTDTAHLLRYLFENHALALPNAPVWRLF